FLALCPKSYKSIYLVDYVLVKELFLYLLIVRWFFRSINLSYFHQISNDLNELTTPGKIRTLTHMLGIRVFDRVLVNSGFNKKVCMSLGVPEKKIEVVYALMKDSPMPSQRVNKKDRNLTNLLFVGGIYERKGLLYAIKAMQKLNRKDLRFDIVGDINKERKYADYLMRMVEDGGLNNQIRFWDRVDKTTLNSLWMNADIFLFPSLFEGFGIVLTEAMLNQLPIITTNVSAMPELVQDHANGILVPPKNPESLAAAIGKLADDSYLRRKMGENGYKKIKKFYDSYSIETKFQNILESLI
ncbi:glycosyltransferase family 4 protein, partial [bacterium]|nr:glycosyltransferase family 4 protein [bacterium]